MTPASPESLAREIMAGTYTPTLLVACDQEITPDRNPHVVRFVEFTLFAEPQPTEVGQPPLYLALQPQRLLNGPRAADLEASFRRDIVEPLVTRWESESRATELPQPSMVRAASARGRGREHALSLRGRVDALQGFLGADVLPEPAIRSLTRTGLVDLLTAIEFPGPFQRLDSRHPLVGVCALYEQVWEPHGYTRGELVSSIGLAPGERLTLEVHTWDKSSRKSEEELATELEIRTTEKFTQRDALTVTQEYAKERNTKVNANGVVPIPKMPIKMGVGVDTQTRQSLESTRESVREQTVEASNTLKINRKTRIEVSRETGREEKQTRVIENTNRCHSLSCQYFEVMANYLVTTRLVAVRPCVLLPHGRPAIDVNWVLCHEGILVESLLDRTFLVGFEAAKILKIHAIMTDLETKERAGQFGALGEQIRPYLDGILVAYQKLVDARDAMAQGIAVCSDYRGLAKEICIAGGGSASQTAKERTIAWFALPEVVRVALEKLSADIAGGKGPAETLRAFLMIATPQVMAQGPSKDEIQERLTTFGWPHRPKHDPLTYDDVGLRAAVEAATTAVTALSATNPPSEQDRVSNRELANAKVEVERLLCHLQENWLHYTQAIMLREDHGQRLMRLQGYGPVALALENELLGFDGDREAYPLRDLSAVPDDLKETIDEAKKLIRSGAESPVLITLPTPGLVLEAMVGECDACEEFIQKSRLIDLRQQDAKARQEEVEANRRQQRLVSTPPDLSDPSPQIPLEIAVTLKSANPNP